MRNRCGVRHTFSAARQWTGPPTSTTSSGATPSRISASAFGRRFFPPASTKTASARPARVLPRELEEDEARDDEREQERRGDRRDGAGA